MNRAVAVEGHGLLPTAQPKECYFLNKGRHFLTAATTDFSGKTADTAGTA